MKFKDLSIGQKDSITKTFQDEDVQKFSQVSLDTNPLHLDDEAAEKSIFGKRIVHGIATCGLISAVLANKLPGPGTIYLGQDVRFTAPVFLGDTITAECEIIELREDKHIVRLQTTGTNQDGKTVLTGTATVKFA
ncbi:MAG: MaoC family dehydratase [Clostridia bacterium]|nr:MaoC family dehydratase [Clostridia bacterium]